MEGASNTPALTGDIVTSLDLPSGGHVVLRDYRELRAKDKRAVSNGIVNMEKVIAAGLDVIEGTIAMLVTSWAIDYLPGAVLPREDISLIGELTIPDYDALVEAVSPAVAVLFPRPATPDDAGRPGSPTVPAGD